MNKNILLIGITLLSIALIFGCTGSGGTDTKEKTTMIFKFKQGYGGTYLGTITPDKNVDNNKFKSTGTIELFTVCGDFNESNWKCKTDPTTKAQTCSCTAAGSINADKANCPMNTEYGCIKFGDTNSKIRALTNQYYAMTITKDIDYVNSLTIFAKGIAGLDKENDLNNLMPGMGNSKLIPAERFYKFVKDEDPISEAYFCDLPLGDMNKLKTASRDFNKGITPTECTKIIP